MKSIEQLEAELKVEKKKFIMRLLFFILSLLFLAKGYIMLGDQFFAVFIVAMGCVCMYRDDF